MILLAVDLILLAFVLGLQGLPPFLSLLLHGFNFNVFLRDLLFLEFHLILVSINLILLLSCN